MKKLKFWNGRSHGHKYRNKGSFYVAAYSQKQAAELVEEASGYYCSVSEIKNYYSPCWGTKISGLVLPCKPSLWMVDEYGTAIQLA